MNQYHIKKEYIIHDTILRRKIKLELLSAPIFLIIPGVVSSIFIYDWFTRGFMNNTDIYNGELILGLIIMIGNIFFGIPFIRSVRLIKREINKIEV